MLEYDNSTVKFRPSWSIVLSFWLLVLLPVPEKPIQMELSQSTVR